MSICSTGNWLSENFYETGAMNMAYVATPGEYTEKKLTYTPTTGTNSCLTGFRMTWKDYQHIIAANDTIHIYLTIDYSDFDMSNTVGTFNLFFQGAYVKSDGTFVWGSNNATSALNIQKSLKTLVLSSSSGSFTYDTTFMLQDKLTEYVGCNIGIRSDYSNGKGMISMRNILITPEKYHLPPPPKKKAYGKGSVILWLESLSKFNHRGGD